MNQGSSASSPRLTGAFVRGALSAPELGLACTGVEPAEFTAVTTDSRKVPKGSLFVAIKGETFDGHAFVDAAIKAGAAGALVEPRAEVAVSTAAVYRVADSLAGYR